MIKNSHKNLNDSKYSINIYKIIKTVIQILMAAKILWINIKW